MKLRIIILAIALVLLSSVGAFPDEGTNQGTWEGEIGATGVVDNVNGSKAKFSEYRDETKGGNIYGDVRLGYDSDNYWMKFSATDIGYKTQNYTLDGGAYGKFTYDLFYNQIIHNITTGALTPYSGLGSNVLYNGTGTAWTAAHPASTNPANWNTFDYSISRNQYGGSFKLDMPKPFYINLGISREDRTGLMPFSNGNDVEIPAPVDYESTTYMGEIGYQAKPVFAALNYAYSTFTNQNQVLSVASTTGSTAALMSLPPDNSVYRLGFKGSLMLPLNSRLNVSLANSHERSTFDLSPLITSSTGFLSSTQFTGRKEIQNYSFSLTSTPVSFLNAKLFYQYYDSANKSENIIQGTGASAFAIPLFGYKKDNYGVNLGFKLPEQFYLATAYSYLDTNRENRPDIPSTKDNVYSAELRWNGLDFVTPKIGYERLERLASYGPPYALSGAVSTANIPFFTMFDAAKQTRNTYKVAVDASPLDDLNLGLAYKFKKSDYPEDTLGVQNAKTNEFEVYGDYLIGGIVRINAYFDLQDTEENLLSYVYGTTTPTTVSSVSSTQYVWNGKQKDDTDEYGVGVDFYVVPKKVTLRVEYDYVNSDGSEDFSFFYPGVVGVTPHGGGYQGGVNTNSNSLTAPVGDPNLNGDVDSYHKSALTFKATYVVSKNFLLAAGASFESYKYNDYGLENPNYQYFSSLTGSYLTGAYANPSYNASVVFITAAYKF
jgi:MtrB/PioB family decaheme-associated outer membrane protein